MESAGERYADRRDAGDVVADALREFAERGDVIVFGLPRGGVVVAERVAARLGATLDVVVVRKLRVPTHPELAMGAIAAVGDRIAVFRHDYVCRRAHVSVEQFERARQRESEELSRRRARWRGQRPASGIAGKVVIVADDGLATGSTMRAAVAAVREHRPAELVVAVPVAAPDAVATLAAEVDRVICPWTPARFGAVSMAYRDFAEVPDEEVTRLLG